MTITPFHRFKFLTQHLRNLCLTGEHAQYVKTHHVARPFPDAVDRYVTIEARQLARFAVADAPQHFHRLRDERGTRFADLIFCSRSE